VDAIPNHRRDPTGSRDSAGTPNELASANAAGVQSAREGTMFCVLGRPFEMQPLILTNYLTSIRRARVESMSKTKDPLTFWTTTGT
jgi:hypothetical protein